MGLDMYLRGKRYLWGMEDHPDSEIAKAIGALLGVTQRVKEIEIEAAYWRKANHIHKWFVDNAQEGVDECQETSVSREQLKTLRDLCQQVLGQRDKAPELLPVQSGFFFGGTDYDEWYFDDLKDTIEQIDKALALPDCWDFYYESSW